MCHSYGDLPAHVFFARYGETGPGAEGWLAAVLSKGQLGEGRRVWVDERRREEREEGRKGGRAEGRRRGRVPQSVLSRLSVCHVRLAFPIPGQASVVPGQASWPAALLSSPRLAFPIPGPLLEALNGLRYAACREVSVVLGDSVCICL